VVSYITDDNPVNRPQIRGYRLSAEHLRVSTQDVTISASDYRRGKLALQGQWVRQLPELWPTLEWQEVITHQNTMFGAGHDASSASLGNYVVVVAGEGITGTRNIGGKEEIVRHDVGPFDLWADGVDVEATQSGRILSSNSA
jgi:hypothetical protein